MEYPTQIVAMIRDAVVILVSLFSLLIFYLTYRKVSAVFNSVSRTFKSLDEIVSTFSDKVSGPAAVGSGLAFGVSKMAAFLMGLSRNKRGREGEDRDE